MGKGGSQYKAYYYYGTVLGAVCRGPVSALKSVVVDGVELLSATVNRIGTEDSRDFTATITAKEPTFLHSKKGRAVIFWGTQTQNIGAVIPSLNKHPGYRGVCVVAFTGLLFGKDRTTAPNIEVVVARPPLPPDGFLDAADDDLVDGEANPVAVMAEILVREMGTPASRLHQDSWRAVAARCRANPGRYYVSPLLREQQAARNFLLDLLGICDAAMRWRDDGTLELVPVTPGGAPPTGALTLDARQWLEPPRLTVGSWKNDVPTTLVIGCADKEARYKYREAKADHLTAWTARGGVPLVQRQELKHVARLEQAAMIAADWIRRFSSPPVKVSGKVRDAVGAGVKPGDKVWCDLEMRPGQPELRLRAALVRRVANDGNGKVSVDLNLDLLAEASIQSVTWTRPAPETPGTPEVRPEDILIVPHPDVPEAVTLLCERPSDTVRGVRRFLSDDVNATDWADLGASDEFACRMTLQANATDSASTLRLAPANGENGPDYGLAENLPETFLDAVNGKVQIVLAKVDAAGRIVTASDGQPYWEIVYVQTRTAVSPGVHDYSVIRARRGTTARAWNTSDTLRVFLLPETAFDAVEHVLLQQLYSTGDEAFFRFRTYSKWGESGNTTARFLPPAAYRSKPAILLTAPSTNPADTNAAGDLAVDVTVHAAKKLLTRLEVFSQKTDGTGYVSRLNQPLSNLTSYQWTATLNFTAGTHVLTFRATDAGGAVSIKTVTVRNLGTALTPPVLTPPEKEYLGNSVTVNISVSAPADRIEYGVVTLGGGPPASWTAYNGTSLNVTLTGKKRLWARAVNTAIPETSEAVYGDYEPYDLR
jgi:hypothetical protein